MAQRNVKLRDIKGVSGEVNIAGRDIIKNIKTIYHRTLTAVEEAARDRQIEGKLLAQGVSLLVQNLSTQASQSTENDNPYKGLLAYNLNEAEIFFGRNEAKKDLLKCIKQDPLTVLHAESGAGKSSLLQAGIAAHLIAEGHLAIRLRCHNTDPAEFIKRTFLPELSQAFNLGKASLREFLRQVCAILGPKGNLYLLLDQFEEFFNLLTKEDRSPFLGSLADCLNDSSLKVRWVLALRAEALSDLAELESFGIAPFKNLYRLNRLSRGEAQAAIIEPAQRYGIAFEPALITHILDTLTTNNEVTPTHLQLVCSALTENLPEDKTLTLAYYTDHEGGTEGILRDYLKRQLEHLPQQEQALAWKVLRALITADRHRAVKSYDEVVSELKLGGLSKEQIDTILTRLVERRLLTTQPAILETFELAHDYLVNEIEIDPKEQARKAAQELLDQEVRTYRRHKTLLTAERLAVIMPYQTELLFSSDAEILISESQKALQQERRFQERRRRVILGGTLAALLAIITTLAGWLITSWQQNSQLKAQRLYAQSLLNQDTVDTKKLLLWAQTISDIPEARFGLFLNYSPVKQRIQPASGGWIFSMDINSDRTLLATGRQDGSVNLWDTSAMKMVNNLAGPKDALVHFIKFSPKGDLLAASFENPDASIYIWHLPEGKLMTIINTKARWAKSITFNPNETLMAASLDGYDEIRIWDITQQTNPVLSRDLLALKGRAASIAFSPDGQLLAAGLMGTPQNENTMLLWDTEKWDVICIMNESTNWIYSLDFDDGGTLIATGGQDNRIRLWDPHACRLAGFLDGNELSVESVEFSPNGLNLVSAGFDNTVRIWNVQEQKAIGLPFKGHTSIVQNAVFGKNDNTIFSGSLDNSIIVWDIEQLNSIGKKILSAGTSIGDLAFDKEGKRLMALTEGGELHLWDATNYQTNNIPSASLGIETVRKAALSFDGKLLAIHGIGYLQVLQIDTGTMIAHFDVDNDFLGNSMSFTPDGGHVILVGNFDRATDYDITNHSKREFDDPKPDQSIDIRVVTVSPDGNYIATGNTLGSITLWDTHTLKPVGDSLQAHHDWITSLAFSPNSKLLASASFDGVVALWDGQTLSPIGLPLVGGHKSSVLSLAFSPDQQALISGGSDNSIVWWSVENHFALGRFKTWDSSPVTQIAFNPDNQSIISGSQAGNIYVWKMDADTLVAYACRIAGRNFTQAEWKQLFPNKKYHETCDQRLLGS